MTPASLLWRGDRPDQATVALLTRAPFAHRGLHGPGVPENSLAAFDAAIAAGHGIELDVRLTFDTDVVVFHDATLERLTDETGRVDAISRAQLETVRLKGSDETLHSLDAVLRHIAGRAPVLVEVKTDGRAHLPTCFPVRRALEGYRGPLAVMSFNPAVVGWFARHSPKVVRGLIVSEEGKRGRVRRGVSRLAALWHARPHFLAYDVRSLPAPIAAAARKRRSPILTWTVRSDADRARAAEHADQIIYERPAT